MSEGLTTGELGKEIAEHAEHASHGQRERSHARRDSAVTIVEALLLSIVALLAAWSGYSAAKWSTKSSLSLARASTARTRSSVAQVQALQIRTLDSVTFNAVITAYAAHNTKLFNVTVRRLRPGYRPAFNAWLATHPLTNPHAPPGPSYMPQYRIPQAVRAQHLDAAADALFSRGEAAAGTADKYVRLTVLFAAVLFLVGIGSRFTLWPARYGLIGVAAAILVVAVVQLAGLPGPPT